MSKYLGQLLALDCEKRVGTLPSKPSKAPFEPFEGSESAHFSRNEPSGPPVHRCSCGAPALIATGWFIRQPERARWFCGGCYERERPRS